MKTALTEILRHALTLAGGTLVAKGNIDAAGLQEAIGAILTLLGIGWAIYSRSKAKSSSAQNNTNETMQGLMLLGLVLLTLSQPSCAFPGTTSITLTDPETGAQLTFSQKTESSVVPVTPQKSAK